MPLDDEQFVIVVFQIEFVQHRLRRWAEGSASIRKEFYEHGSLDGEGSKGTTEQKKKRGSDPEGYGH
jgi:hypothetical protein